MTSPTHPPRSGRVGEHHRPKKLDHGVVCFNSFKLLMFALFDLFFYVFSMSNMQPDQLPDPEIVFRAAEEEPMQRLLDDYTAAIHELRDKNFTFREIAEWLKKFGFDVDHNAVYRAYAKTVPDHVLAQQEEDDNRREQDDAMRDFQMNGPRPASNSNPAPESLVEASAKGKAAKAARKPAKSKKKQGN